MGLGLLFALMAIRRAIPEPAFHAALAILMLWVIWLAAWRFIPALRIRRVFGNSRLPPLDAAERDWRNGLSMDDRASLEIHERLFEKRLTRSECAAILEVRSATSREDSRHAAEKANYEAGLRAEAAERKDLEVIAIASPLEFQAEDGSSCWLQLGRIDPKDPDEAFRAPVRCTTWPNQAATRQPGNPTFLSLAESIAFPPDEYGVPIFWESAPPAFKAMFRSRCLVSGVDVADDSRERFDLRIGQKAFTIMTKYLGWRTDLALDEDKRRVWVRISGMNTEVWSAPDAEGRRIFEDIARIPAFVYPIPADRLIPTSHPDRHFDTLEALLSFEE